MTSNHELKSKCKETLDAIRSTLVPEERQKIETHLREILEITKGLMDNAKVSPEDHQTLASQVAMLTQELSQKGEEMKAVRREADMASQLKEELTSIKSFSHALKRERDFLRVLNADTLCTSFHSLSINATRLVESDGDVVLSKWVKQLAATLDNAQDRRALFLACLLWAGLTFDEATVSEVVAHLSNIGPTETTGQWLEDVRNVFAMCGVLK